MRSFRKAFSVIILVCMLVSMAVIQGNAFAADNPVSKVTVTFYGDTGTSKGFTWHTGLASTHSDLEIVKKCGEVSGCSQAVKPDFSKAIKFLGRYSISTNDPLENVHKVEATGLKENTTYYFRVGDAALGIWSDVGTFHTAAKNGFLTESFSFIDLADTQALDEDEAILSSQTIAKALATVPKAKFIVHGGDVVENGNVEAQWNWLLGHSQQSLLNTTILIAAGNHDNNKNAFIEHFDIKPADSDTNTTTGAYYSVNYGNTHYVVLNTNENSTIYADFSPEQIQWLKDDVAKARTAGAKWIIVNMHKGPYTTANHATDSDIMGATGTRTLVAPIMADLGIDLVLQGHDHIYARSKPIKNGAASPTNKITEMLNGRKIEYSVRPNGTIFLIPATAGAKVYYKNKKIDPSYFSLFDVANENSAAVYGPDPADPTRPKRSQIQTFVGITVDDRKLTAVTYEIDQNKNNAQPYIVDQFGIVK